MPKRLSVCLLTRNDGQHLERAIRSVEGIADEVIVVDTGSTDRSREIASDLGARMVQHEWDYDYSAGRNAALAAATGDWILWLNPDEELIEASRASIPGLLDVGDEVFAYLVRIHNIQNLAKPDLYSETVEPRLFRRRPNVQYVGRLLPGFTEAFGQTIARERKQILPSDLTLKRYAFADDIDAGKLRWALRLIERELQDRPGRLPYLLEYGRTLLMLEDPQGHAVMAQAAEQVAQHANQPTPPSPETQFLLNYVITTPTHLYQGSLPQAKAVELALRWFPSSPPLLWAIAEPFFRKGEYQPAAAILERLVELGQSGRYDRSVAFDPALIGPPAQFNLAQCLRLLGQNDRARALLEPLLTIPELTEPARRQLAELDATPSRPS